MTAKLVVEKDGYVGFRTSTDSNDSNFTRFDAEKNTPEPEVILAEKILYMFRRLLWTNLSNKERMSMFSFNNTRYSTAKISIFRHKPHPAQNCNFLPAS